MLVRDIGIIGLGQWQGEPIENDHFAALVAGAQAKDPYKGRRADDGTIRIAGMELGPDRFARTIAAIERSFQDPFRGTRRRRYFPADLAVSTAETEAARAALEAAKISAEDVDALLVQSFLPDGIQPKNGPIIANNLGITRAPAWEVDSICNSAITHFTVAGSLITSGFARHVLCVQSTAYSRVTDPGASSSVQEGDMATAFVVGASPGTRAAVAWRTDGRLHGAIKLHWATPTGVQPRRWWERSQESLMIGFDPELQSQVMSEIESNARVVCTEALARAELRTDDIDILIGTQAMAWYSPFLSDVLGLRDDVVFDTFTEYGNISSSGPVATMLEATRIGRIRRGSKVLLFGPAAGYTFAAAVIEW